jgi:hypothetical protein
MPCVKAWTRLRVTDQIRCVLFTQEAGFNH